jgi:hypothetical protein
MISEIEKAFVQGKIVAISQAVINEEIGVIAASRRLNSLGFQLFGDHREEFMLFTAIDSETDHLPVDRERKNWSNEALERKDKEIHAAEAFYCKDVIAQCGELIQLFQFNYKSTPSD